MKRPFAALFVVAVVVAPSWGGAEPAAAREPVGVFSPFDGSGPIFARLAPGSLRPGRPRLDLGEYHQDWSFSPDGSQLALGMGGQGNPCGRGICIVDVATMRIAGYVHASVAVEAIAWLRPRRIVGLVMGGEVILADPVTETVIRSSDLPFRRPSWPPVARTSEGLAVLMRRPRPPHLVVVNAHGDVRIVALRRIGRRPGLAAARRGGRAFVVAAGGLVAEVNLRTMGVRYHRVPSLRATGSSEAVWLGRGLLAAVNDRGGVQVIDTRTWNARTVSLRATRARLAAGRLLLWSDGDFGRRRGGVGLSVYSRDGRRLVRHLFGKRELVVEVAGEHAYALRPGAPSARAVHVVRARTGELVGTVAPPPRGYEVQILSSPLGSNRMPR